MLLLFVLSIQAAPAVLPFEGGPEAMRAQKAFVVAAKEAHVSFAMARMLGVDLRPAVQACKGDLLCLTQIGSALEAAQIVHTQVKGSSARTRVIATADATVLREVTVALGTDPLRAYKDAVFAIFGVSKPGEIEIIGLPTGAIISVDEDVKAGRMIIAKPGVRLLRVRAPGVDNWVREVFVRADEKTVVKFAPEIDDVARVSVRKKAGWATDTTTQSEPTATPKIPASAPASQPIVIVPAPRPLAVATPEPKMSERKMPEPTPIKIRELRAAPSSAPVTAEAKLGR